MLYQFQSYAGKIPYDFLKSIFPTKRSFIFTIIAIVLIYYGFSKTALYPKYSTQIIFNDLVYIICIFYVPLFCFAFAKAIYCIWPDIKISNIFRVQVAYNIGRFVQISIYSFASMCTFMTFFALLVVAIMIRCKIIDLSNPSIDVPINVLLTCIFLTTLFTMHGATLITRGWMQSLHIKWKKYQPSPILYNAIFWIYVFIGVKLWLDYTDISALLKTNDEEYISRALKYIDALFRTSFLFIAWIVYCFDLLWSEYVIDKNYKKYMETQNRV